MKSIESNAQDSSYAHFQSSSVELAKNPKFICTGIDFLMPFTLSLKSHFCF